MNKFTRLLMIFAFMLSTTVILPGAGSPASVARAAEEEPYTEFIYLPYVNLTRSYTISGKVLDQSGNPIAGASVVDQLGGVAVTNAQGKYEIDVPEGQVALAPSMEGYIFTPAMADLSVEGNMSEQNFQALAACTDGITNGSFESTTWWRFPNTEWNASYTTAKAHTGARSARTGILNYIDNRYSYSSVRSPSMIIPSGGTAKLRLWLDPLSTEAALAPVANEPEAGSAFGEAIAAYDAQYILILDPNNNLLETLMWVRSNNGFWSYHEFNLTKYAGRSIKVEMGSYNDGYGGVTSMFVDDVAVEICTGTVTPTPTTCGNVITNSDFEYSGGWNIPVTEYPAGYSTDYASTGVRSMRTGIPLYAAANRYSYSDAWQTVYIPTTATNAKLRVDLLPMSAEVYATALEGEVSPARESPALEGTPVPEGTPSPATMMPQLQGTPVPPGSEAPANNGSPAGAPPEAPAEGEIWGSGPLAGDAQYILILNPYTQAIIKTLLWWNPKNATGWVHREFDLSAYRGQYIRIQFGTYNNGYGGRTVMYVDNLTLDTCATITPTTTTTSTVTPTATSTPVCNEKLVNGGFETGTGWYIPITAFTAGYSSMLAHTGSRSMRTGIYYPAHNRYSYSDFRQTVSIPWAATSSTLTYWTYDMSGEVLREVELEKPTAGDLSIDAVSGDVQYLLVLDVWGNWIDTLMWKRSNAGYWRKYTFNLGRFAGSTIMLQWGTYNNGWSGVTSMYVDDASLQVCP